MHILNSTWSWYLAHHYDLRYHPSIEHLSFYCTWCSNKNLRKKRLSHKINAIRFSMACMTALDLSGDTGIPSASLVFGSAAMNGDEYVRCAKCGFGGCDVRVSGCGCTLHAVSIFFCFAFTYGLYEVLRRRHKLFRSTIRFLTSFFAMTALWSLAFVISMPFFMRNSLDPTEMRL